MDERTIRQRPTNRQKKEASLNMQIRRAPGQKQSEITQYVQEHWENGTANAWQNIDKWDKAFRTALIAIAEAVEGMPDKEKHEQWKAKLEEWKAANPMPRELDDMRRQNYARGIKPLLVNLSVNKNAKTIKFSKDEIEKAKEESSSLAEKFISFLESKKEKNK